MSEILKNQTSNTQESGWEELSEIKFSGEQQKPVGELSAKEAAQEYCDLLLELSKGFESAEGKTSRVAGYGDGGKLFIHPSNEGYSDARQRIVGKLWETRTGEKFDALSFRRSGQVDSDGVSHFEDPYYDRELSMDLADNIISAESEWRAAGEGTTIENENKLHAEGQIYKEKLDKFEGGRLGALRSVLRPRKHEKLVKAARESSYTPAEGKTHGANYRLQKALEEAYSPDYGYGHHGLSAEHAHSVQYQQQVNEEYNNKFFSSENMPMINRAVELRRKLEVDGKLK